VLDVSAVVAGVDVAELRSGVVGAGWRPVLAVLPRDQEARAAEVLAEGAGDCVADGVPAEEVALRVERLLHRCPPKLAEPIVVGSLVIDVVRHQVEARGRRVAMSPTKYQLLVTLARRIGEVVTIRELLEAGWDAHQEVTPELLRPQITRLRCLLDGAASVRSVRGRGYVLEPIVEAPPEQG